MYYICIGIQALATLLCLVSVFIIAYQKPTSYSNFIIITFICGLVQNVGYLLELLSTNVGEGMVAVRIEYLGGAFEISLIIFFMFKYCGHELNKYIKAALICEALLVLFGVWSYGITDIYYTEARFIEDSAVPHLSMGHGWLYYEFAITTIIELLACLFIMFVSMIKTGRKHMRYNYIVLMAVVLVPLMGFIFAIIGGIDGFDTTPLSVAISIGIFAFAIAGKHVFDVADAAGERILQDLDNAIIILNSEGGYEYSNTRANDLFPVLKGYRRGNKMKDSTINSIFDPASKNQISISDSIFDVNVNTVKVHDEEIGVAAILFDVTESRNQLERMKVLMAEAEQANLSKSAFLSNMTHEIRSPINLIMGMSEIMLRDYQTPETKKYLVNIKNSTDTLLNLINDVLDYSRFETGKMKLNEDRIDLKKLLLEIVNTYNFRAKQKGIDFNYELAADVPRYVVGDELKLKQVISNLLSNAVKYTENGYVKLKMAHKDRNNDDIDLIVAVEDTGAGIDKNIRDTLFTDYVESDMKALQNDDGTGIGLNLTRRIVEMMGGVINFKSEIGKGTTFSVVIPLKSCSDDLETVDELVGTAGGDAPLRTVFIAPKAKVLLVDDSTLNLMITKELLKETKAEVTTAISGEECLELVRNNRFDIIFMDHRMPGMDGIETLSRIRQTNNMCQHTPVIANTANASSDAKAFYIEKGFTDFLAKPITEEQLTGMLYKYLPEYLIEHIGENT